MKNKALMETPLQIVPPHAAAIWEDLELVFNRLPPKQVLIVSLIAKGFMAKEIDPKGGQHRVLIGYACSYRAGLAWAKIARSKKNKGSIGVGPVIRNAGKAEEKAMAKRTMARSELIEGLPEEIAEDVGNCIDELDRDAGKVKAAAKLVDKARPAPDPESAIKKSVSGCARTARKFGARKLASEILATYAHCCAENGGTPIEEKDAISIPSHMNQSKTA